MSAPSNAMMRGSAVEAVAGLVGKNGQPLAPSSDYLKAQAVAEQRHERDRAWRHYIGKHIDKFFRAETGQPDVNVLTNRAATIVDTGVDFLYGKTVTFEVMRDGKPQKDAQACLDGCWGKDAKRMTLLSKLAQNGGIFGHVFVKIIEPNDDRPYCRIVPLDPAQVTVITEEDDVDTVTAYIVEWLDPDVSYKDLQVGRRQVIIRNDPDDETDHEDNNDLFSYDSDATWIIRNQRRVHDQWFDISDPIEWPHQWPPIVDWQNLPLANMHWGQSDIPANIQHLNSVLNLILSDANANAKFHSFPWMYATAVNTDTKIPLGPGQLVKFPSPDAKITALEAHGDINGLLSFADNIRADMDEQTRVPSVATGRLRDVPRVTSGVAFQMMYGPLLGKTTHKQRLYEQGHEETSLRMLSLCGYGDGTGMDGWEVVTKWPSPLPNDDQATAQMALAAKQVGMSQHFIICDIYQQDYDQEMDHRKDEAKEELANMLKGQGMPGQMLQKPGQLPDGGQPGANGGQAQGNGGQQPPVNNPAAVAQRNAVKKVSAAMKAG